MHELASLLFALGASAGLAVSAPTAEKAAVSWQGPAGCRPVGVEARMRSVLEDSGRRLDRTIDVRVTESAAGFVAEVVVDGGAPRTLQSPDCGVIERAAAQVVLASVPDAQIPEAVGDATEDDGDHAHGHEDNEGHAGEPEEQEEPGEPRDLAELGESNDGSDNDGRRVVAATGGSWIDRRGRFVAEVAPAVGARIDRTGAQAALALHGGFGGARWRLVAGATHGVQRRVATQTSDGSGVSASTRSLGGEAQACFIPGRGRWSVPLCAGASVRALWVRGEGQGVTRRTGRRAWLVALAGAALRVEVHRRLDLQLRSQAQVSLNRPRFHVQRGLRAIPVFQPSAVAGLVDAGVVVHWSLGDRIGDRR